MVSRLCYSEAMAQTKQKSKPKAKDPNYTGFAPGTVTLPKKHTPLTRAFTGGCIALVATMAWGAIATLLDPSIGSEDDSGTGLVLMLAFLLWLVVFPYLFICLIVMLVRVKKVAHSENIYRVKVLLATIAVVLLCFFLANLR